MLASVAGQQPQLLLAVTPVLAFASRYAVQESSDDLRVPKSAVPPAIVAMQGYLGCFRKGGQPMHGHTTICTSRHILHAAPLSPAA